MSADEDICRDCLFFSVSSQSEFYECLRHKIKVFGATPKCEDFILYDEKEKINAPHLAIEENKKDNKNEVDRQIKLSGKFTLIAAVLAIIGTLIGVYLGYHFSLDITKKYEQPLESVIDVYAESGLYDATELSIQNLINARNNINLNPNITLCAINRGKLDSGELRIRVIDETTGINSSWEVFSNIESGKNECRSMILRQKDCFNTCLDEDKCNENSIKSDLYNLTTEVKFYNNRIKNTEFTVCLANSSYKCFPQ